MSKVFDNPNKLTLKVIQSRLFSLDKDAVVRLYTLPASVIDGTPAHDYVEVDSIASDADITTQLSTPITANEQSSQAEFDSDRATFRTQYQNTVDQLLNIENTASPTNAQVIASVKYLAQTLRLLLRLLVKTRFSD